MGHLKLTAQVWAGFIVDGPSCNWLAIPRRFTTPVATLHLMGWIPVQYFAACRAQR